MTQLYRSDRGDVYEVSKMETSHLINVITHHQNQIMTLEALNIYARAHVLCKVVEVLRAELAQRPVDIAQYLPEEYK